MVFGQLVSIGSNDVKDRLWAQVDGSPGGEMIIDNFGFIFKIGNGEGASVEYGKDKAVTKNNGLSLHPYWESHSNCGVRWTLVN